MRLLPGLDCGATGGPGSVGLVESVVAGTFCRVAWEGDTRADSGPDGLPIQHLDVVPIKDLEQVTT